jgi:putative addiction module component (TIGR02574 family)
MAAAEFDFSKLSIDGKLDLIGRIWDSISPKELAISDELFAELEKDRAE